MVNDISCRYRIQLVVEAAAGGIVPDIAQILQEALVGDYMHMMKSM